MGQPARGDFDGDQIVKERPILFSGDMVRAILADRKTQTRRVVKLPDMRFEYIRQNDDFVPAGEAWLCEWDGDEHNGMELHQATLRSPYGVPGDRLWVRECFRYQDFDCDEGVWYARMRYRADDFETPSRTFMPKGEDTPIGWKPSIHMPRWASRITLEVTGVRVERVQEMDPRDAYAEGFRFEKDGIVVISAEAKFRYLWDKLNNKRGFGWDKNPWVWVIEFRRITDGSTG